jgi:hypothetical protein
MTLTIIIWIITAFLVALNLLLMSMLKDTRKYNLLTQSVSYFGLTLITFTHSIFYILLIRVILTLSLLVSFIITVKNLDLLNSMLFLLGALLLGYLIPKLILFYKSSIIGGARNFKESNFLFNASKGNLQIIKVQIEKGINVNCADIDGNTALHFAARNGHIEIIKLLVSSEANVNIKDSNQSSPIYDAIKNNHIDIVKYLVKMGASLNKIDKIGCTPLLAATYSNKSIELIKYLIESGSDVNFQNVSDGQTPLMVAKYFDNKEVIKLLLNNGANINATDFRGLTAADYSKKSNR